MEEKYNKEQDIHNSLTSHTINAKTKENLVCGNKQVLLVKNSDIPLSCISKSIRDKNLNRQNGIELNKISTGSVIDNTKLTFNKKVEDRDRSLKIILEKKQKFDSMLATKESKNNDFADRRVAFIQIFDNKSKKFGIPCTPTLKKKALLLYDSVLEKLDFLNDRMMELYSCTLLYRNSNTCNKKSFLEGNKAEIFNRALEEVDKLTNDEPNEETESNKIICNLYKIVS